MNWLLSMKGRQWLYRVAAAVIPVAALYGLIEPETAPAWLAVAAALFGVAAPAMALTHMTPDSDDAPAE